MNTYENSGLSSITKHLKESVVITGIATATLFCIYSAFTYSFLRELSIDYRLFEHPFNNSLYVGVVISVNNFGYVFKEIAKIFGWSVVFISGAILATIFGNVFFNIFDFIRNPPPIIIGLSKFYEKKIEPIFFLIVFVLFWILMVYHFQNAGANYAALVKEAKTLPFNMTILHDDKKKKVHQIICDKDKCAGLEKISKNIVYFKFSDINHTTFE